MERGIEGGGREGGKWGRGIKIKKNITRGDKGGKMTEEERRRKKTAKVSQTKERWMILFPHHFKHSK